MSKFKVGDIVKATTDMYGQTNRKYNWQGVVMQVNGSRFDAKTIKSTSPDNVVGEIYFWLNEDNFELVDSPCTKEIHISVEGNTVHAVMKEGGKVIKCSKAICSKDDEFDFQIGAELAFNRLFEDSSFFPHLQCETTGECLGKIGEPTDLVDYNGNLLCVGDVVVMIHPSNNLPVISIVVKDKRPKSFIWGISAFCNPDGGAIEEYEVYKIRDYHTLKNLDCFECVTAILEEKIKCK